MNRTRIVIAGHTPEAEPAYLILDELGSVVGRGVLAVQDGSALAPLRTVLVIPGAEVLVRWLPLRAGSEAQARGAALAALEDQLAAPEGAHAAVGPADAEGLRPCAVIAARRLQGWLDHARLHGLSPEVVIPDCLALPAPPDDEAVLTAAFEETVAVRGARLAFSGEPDLLAAVAADRPQTRLEGPALERALAEAAGAPAVNLLQGAFDPKRQAELGWRDFRRVAALAAAVLLSPLLIWGAQAAAFNIRAERAEARAEAKLAALLPEGAEVTDVAVQAEALLAQAMVGQGGGASGLAAILLGALEPLDQAQLESLIVMPDGTARAAVSLAAYSDTEALAQALQAEGLSMREEGSREEGDRVVADIILGAR